MNKKSSNAIVIAVSVLAVCLVAIAAVLIVKFSGSKIDVESKPPENNTVNQETEATSAFDFVVSTTAEALSELVSFEAPSASEAQPTQAPAESESASQPGATQAPTVAPTEELTEPPTEQGKVDKGDIPSTPSSGLPADMTLAGMYHQGYDTYGFKQYIFNDDKDPNSMKANFGYNELYDKMAVLIDFHIDTCKLPFEYNGKKYRIQLWKGQYISGEIGTVGGEIGLYTREPGKAYLPDHYDCAPKNEWLYMEMTCFWDEKGDGNYKAQFTREYDLYWWATGFVDGQLADLKDTNPLRILGRITFKDVAQAQAFEGALANKGFKSVSTFRHDAPDTYKRYGKDVIFLWQYIR